MPPIDPTPRTPPSVSDVRPAGEPTRPPRPAVWIGGAATGGQDGPTDATGAALRGGVVSPDRPAPSDLAARFDRDVLTGEAADAQRSALAVEHRELVKRRLLGGLTPAQQRRLGMVRWLLGRFDHARSRGALDRLEEQAARWEQLARALTTWRRAVDR